MRTKSTPQSNRALRDDYVLDSGLRFFVSLLLGVFILCGSSLGLSADLCPIKLSDLKKLGAQNDYSNGIFKKGEEKWPIDGQFTQNDSNWSYNNYFYQALEGKSLEEIAIAYHSQGRDFHVADLFGSAVFSNHPILFTSLTGIRWSAASRNLLPREYPAPNWNEVYGDIYSSKLWHSVELDMKTRGIPSYNLIIIRPVGPLRSQAQAFLVKNERKFVSLFFQANGVFLRRAWNRLNNDGGEMLIQIQPEILNEKIFKDWIELLKNSGIEADVFEKSHVTPNIGINSQVLRLRRSTQSPNELPL